MTSTATPTQTNGATAGPSEVASGTESGQQAVIDPARWRPFQDSTQKPEEQVPPGIQLIRAASDPNAWTKVSEMYGKVFPGAPISSGNAPTAKDWGVQSAGPRPASPSENGPGGDQGQNTPSSSSTPSSTDASSSTNPPPSGPLGTNRNPIHNPTREYPSELRLPPNSGIPNFGGTFQQFALSSDRTTRWHVKWQRPGTEGVEVFQSRQRIVGDGELAYPADLRVKENEKFGGAGYGQRITNELGLLDEKWMKMSVEERKKYRFKNGQPLFDNNGNPTFTTVRQLFFENGQAGQGTQALINLEMAAGLTADRFRTKREVTTDEHRVLLGQSKHSGHWYVLTPDGKGGQRTYHIGEKEPTDDEIRKKIQAKAFSHVWARQSNQVITINALTPEGEPGFKLEGIPLNLGPGGALWINSESKDGRTRWIATLHRPGKSPQVVYTFPEKPDKEDFAANTPAFRELQKILNPATAKAEARQRNGTLVYEDGAGEVFIQENRTTRGLTWKMLFFPTGNKPAIDLGSTSTKPKTADFSERGQFRDELLKAQGKTITPPVLQNREAIEIEHSGKKLKVIVGSIGDSWYILTPRKGGGWSTYDLDRPETKKGADGNPELTPAAQELVRKMMRSGAFSQLMDADGKGVANPFLRRTQ